MAWLVLVNFSSFSILPRALACPTELCPKIPARFVVSSTRLTTATVRISSSSCITRQSLGYNRHIGIPFGDSSAFNFLLSDINDCPRMLTGYWIGPDTEDGWGFVEAFIHKIL